MITGTKSPKYVQTMAVEVEKLLINGKLSVLPGLSHSAPDNEAPEKIALVLKDFFES